MQHLFQRLRQFFGRDLWADMPTPSRLKALLFQTIRIFVLAGRNFWLDRCMMRATSLAFVTLLSLVPLLAFAFSVLKGFDVGDRIKPWLLHQMVGTSELPEGTPQERKEEAEQEPSPEEQARAGQKRLVEGILTAVDRTDVRALGTVGLLFLLWTAIKLLSTVEATFNHIWNVTRSRPLVRKITDYVSVVVIAPILLLVAMSVTTGLQSAALVRHLRETAVIGPVAALLLSWLPYVGTWVAFTAVYMFMPNTRVRLRGGLLGGVVAGTMWQLAFWAYTYFQIGLARYGAIYTTFAALPIFMVWLYLSWTVVLFGAEVAHASQNVGRYWEERRSAGASFAVLEAIGMRTMIALSVSFHTDGRALTIEEIGDRIKAPGRLIREVLQRLVTWGICTETLRDNGTTAYQPGRTLEKITPADVLAALRHYGQPLTLSSDEPQAKVATELLASHDPARDADLSGTNFREIAAQLEQEGAASASE